jgi:hypothetical protein
MSGWTRFRDGVARDFLLAAAGVGASLVVGGIPAGLTLLEAFVPRVAMVLGVPTCSRRTARAEARARCSGTERADVPAR